jgi:hypothetical protein
MPKSQPQKQIAPDDYQPDINAVINSEANKNNYRIPIEDIIFCIDVLKLNQSQTARRLGCDSSNISQRLKAYGYEPGYLDTFKEHQADLYAIRRARIAKHLTDDKLEKMSAYQLVGMDSVTLNSERLIRGESTSNISHLDMVRAKELVDNKIKAFESKYNLDDDSNNDT